MKFIMIHGGNPNTVYLCKKAGWDYGVQFGATMYHNLTMTDFVKGSWSKYLNFLKLHNPPLALACDWLEASEISLYRQRIDDILSLGIKPVVAVKHPSYFEENYGLDVRIGISVPTRHMNDGWLPARDYMQAGQEIHLLGGHPDQWKWFIRYYCENGQIVESIDGNSHYEQARTYGKFWSQWGYYRQMPAYKYNTNAMAICSMRNAKRYLENNAPIHDSERITECKKQLGLIPKQLSLL